MKYQRSTALCWKYIGIRKPEFVTKTQFLSVLVNVRIKEKSNIIGKVYKENKNVIGYWEGLAGCKKIIKWCKGAGEGLVKVEIKGGKNYEELWKRETFKPLLGICELRTEKKDNITSWNI